MHNRILLVCLNIIVVSSLSINQNEYPTNTADVQDDLGSTENSFNLESFLMKLDGKISLIANSLQELKEELKETKEDHRTSIKDLKGSFGEFKSSIGDLKGSFGELEASISDLNANYKTIHNKMDSYDKHLNNMEFKILDEFESIKTMEHKIEDVEKEVISQSKNIQNIILTANKNILVLSPKECEEEDEDSTIKEDTEDVDENRDEFNEDASLNDRSNPVYQFDKIPLNKKKGNKRQIPSSTRHRVYHQHTTLHTFIREIMQYIQRFMVLKFRQLFKEYSNIILTNVHSKMESLRNDLHLSGQTGREQLKSLIFKLLTKNYDMYEEFKTRDELHKEILSNISKALVNIVDKIQPNMNSNASPITIEEKENDSKMNKLAKSNAIRPKGGLADQTYYSSVDSKSLLCTDTTTIQEVLKSIDAIGKQNVNLSYEIKNKTSQSLDMLTKLHQRFSSLMKKLNMDNSDAKVLLSGIQQLEALVRQSFTNILMSQNSIINSFYQLQSEEPNIEEKLLTLLGQLDLSNKLLKSHISKLEIPQTKDHPMFAQKTSSCELAVEAFEKLDFVSWVINSMNETDNLKVKFVNVYKRIISIYNRLIQPEFSYMQDEDFMEEIISSTKQLKSYSGAQIDNVEHVYDIFSKVLDTYLDITDKQDNLNTTRKSNNATIGHVVPKRNANFIQDKVKLSDTFSENLSYLNLTGSVSENDFIIPDALNDEYLELDYQDFD